MPEFPSSLYSIDDPGHGAHRRAVGASNIQPEKHDFGALAGKRCEIGDMLGNQDAAAEQRVVHRKGETGWPERRGKIWRWAVDADELRALFDQPGRRLAGEAGVLHIALGIDVTGARGVDQHDVAR